MVASLDVGAEQKVAQNYSISRTATTVRSVLPQKSKSTLVGVLVKTHAHQKVSASLSCKYARQVSCALGTSWPCPVVTHDMQYVCARHVWML